MMAWYIPRWGSLGGWMLVGASAWIVGCGSSTAEPAADVVAAAEQWCAQAPAQLCSARKPCCESGRLGWDATQCEAKEAKDCSTNAVQVKAGKRGFDPNQAAACVEDTHSATAKCRLTSDDYALRLHLKQSCKGVFPGAVAPGNPCDSSADCASEAGSLGFCDASHTCTVRTRTKDGDPCVEDSGACDTGLYCDTWSTGSKTCRNLVDVGQPCPHGVECVPNAFCDPSSKVCTRPLAEGATCVSNDQCDSFSCTISNLCAPVGAYLTKAECGE